MSGASKNKSGSYFVDRALLPRVQKYLKENNHRKFIDVEEMADVLQRQYPDYGRKKKLPFRKSVQQGNLSLKIIKIPCFNNKPNYVFANLAYEDISGSLIVDEETDSDPEQLETSAIADEKRQPANESIRSMYSTNRSTAGDDTKLDDIMVIDVLGDHAKSTPQSSPVKQVILC